MFKNKGRFATSGFSVKGGRILGCARAYARAGSYYLLVKLEEIAYNNFINREWPTRTLKYTEENSPLVGEYINNRPRTSAGVCGSERTAH